jgi:hypothetical protein
MIQLSDCKPIQGAPGQSKPAYVARHFCPRLSARGVSFQRNANALVRGFAVFLNAGHLPL